MTCIIHTPVGDRQTSLSLGEVKTLLNGAKRDNQVAEIPAGDGDYVLVDPATAVISYGSLRPTIRMSDLAEPITHFKGERARLDDSELLDELRERLLNDENDLLTRAQEIVPEKPAADVDLPSLVASHTDGDPELRGKIASIVGDVPGSVDQATGDQLVDALRDRLHGIESGEGLEDKIRDLLPPSEPDRQDLEAEAEPFAQPKQDDDGEPAASADEAPAEPA